MALDDSFFFDDADMENVLGSMNGDGLTGNDLFGINNQGTYDTSQQAFDDQAQFNITPTGGFDLGKLINQLGGAKGIAQLVGGVAGTIAARNTGKSYANQAQQLLQNADPYLQYRKEAEIPFMLQQMQQYGNVQNRQNTLADLIASKQGQTNPVVQALQQRALNTDPLGSDYRKYQDTLQQTYSDPMGYYNSSGYQALANQLGQQIARRDAAKGRLSQYGDRATEMQANFLKDIGNYRQGLSQAAQVAGGAQNTAYGQGLAGIANLQNADTQALSGLSQLFNAQTSNLNYLGGLITPRGTAGQGAATAAQLAGMGAAQSNAAYAPLVDSVIKSFGG